MCGRIVGCCIRDCDLTGGQETKKAKTKSSPEQDIIKISWIEWRICNCWSYWEPLVGWADFLCFLGFDTLENIV